MIQRHKPVDRIFDVIHVDAMSDSEMDEFFTSAFKSVGISVEPGAPVLFRVFSAGLPKIMQMLGDSAYWIDRDANIDREDVGQAAFATAEDVGRKFVDQQVFNALRSEKYQAILDIIGQQAPLEMSFVCGDIMASFRCPAKGVRQLSAAYAATKRNSPRRAKGRVCVQRADGAVLHLHHSSAAQGTVGPPCLSVCCPGSYLASHSSMFGTSF